MYFKNLQNPTYLNKWDYLLIKVMKQFFSSKFIILKLKYINDNFYIKCAWTGGKTCFLVMYFFSTITRNPFIVKILLK